MSDEYPKIETLLERDPRTHKVIPLKYRWPEFDIPRYWRCTEKVDGTNVRVSVNTSGEVTFGGRTDDAQLHATLVDYLRRTFTSEKMVAAFEQAGTAKLAEAFIPMEVATIYAEGYGPKIQKGGGNYRGDVAVRIFDVRVGNFWLEPDNVDDVAAKLGVKTVPEIGHIEFFDCMPETSAQLAKIFGQRNGGSIVAAQDGGVGCEAEGIVARTVPMLFTRKGDRLMWKLKFKDFAA